MDGRAAVDEDRLAGDHPGGGAEQIADGVRNVLRLGVYELLYVEDVPDGVAVSEAMNLVRDLSTDDSPSFVNGLLGSIVRDKADLV